MPPLLRPPRPQARLEVDSICIKCIRRLIRVQPPPRRQIGSTAKYQEATLVAPRQHEGFKKQYFWTNDTLKGLLDGKRRSLWSRAAEEKSTEKVATVPVSATASSSGAQSVSATTERSMDKEELPHRRRKRLREAAKGAEASVDELAEKPLPPDASSILSTLSQSYSPHTFKRRLTTYLSLSKPRLTFLIVLTTTAAYSAYPVPALLSTSGTETPSLSTLTLLFLTTGTFLCCASANTFNMLLESQHDAKMSRTRNRPLVRKLITTRSALVFALVIGATGTGLLYLGTNPTTAFLGAFNIFLYAGVYTPLKRVHTINTWAGALVGAIPPLMGWAAAAGQCAVHGGGWDDLLFSEGSIGGWLFAALLFAWQFPHFNALSWPIRFEYRDAGYRMMAWVNPGRNGRVALRYSILMFPICYGLVAAGVCDPAFFATSSVVNSWMVWEAVKFWRHEGHKGTARGLFWASVWQLPIVLVLAMAQKKGLWDRVWRALTGETELEDDENWEDELPDGEEGHTTLVASGIKNSS